MFKSLIFFAGMLIMALLVKFNIAASWVYPETTKPVEKTVTVTKEVTNPGVPSTIRVFHDDSRGVTCYEGKQSPLLSCVPDIQLRPKL